MTQMKLTSHVGWRDRDDEWFAVWIETRLVRIVGWLEVSILLPPGVNSLFDGFEIIGFG
jgi:hypothetical protein